MQIKIELNTGEVKYYLFNCVRLDYGIFKPKRKSEQCLKIYTNDKIIIIKLSDISFFVVEE